MIMVSLFSVFDPTSYLFISLNWFIILLIMFMYPVSLYLVKGGWEKMFSWIVNKINNLLEEVSGKYNLGLVFISIMMFLYLLVMNLLGLLPFIFSSTAHPIITMGFGLVFWLSFVLMGWIKNFKMMAVHMVPEGSPLLLSSMMVLIETISHLMRPFTLSIRLAANIMAGHLIISLLSSISLINYLGFMSSFILQSILLILEFGVAIIQAFVFSILLVLYALESY